MKKGGRGRPKGSGSLAAAKAASTEPQMEQDHQKMADTIISQFKTAVQNSDIKSIKVFLTALKDENMESYPEVVNILKERGVDKLKEEAVDLFSTWVKSIVDTAQVGDMMDVFYSPNNAWFEGKIIAKDDKAGAFLFKYTGWPGQDGWVFFSDMNIAPVNSFTTSKSNKKKQGDVSAAAANGSTVEEASVNTPVVATAAPTAAAAAAANVAIVSAPSQQQTEEVTIVTTTGRGRRAAQKQDLALLLNPKASKKRKAIEQEQKNVKQEQKEKGEGEQESAASAAEDDHHENVAATSPGTEKKNNKNKTTKPEPQQDDHDWLCDICDLLESADGSDLVLCDGPCKKSFHRGCLLQSGSCAPPLDEAEEGGEDTREEGEEDWYCEECLSGRHKCFLCHERGVDFKEVCKCSFKGKSARGENSNPSVCGKYYHRACLEKGMQEEAFPACKIEDMTVRLPVVVKSGKRANSAKQTVVLVSETTVLSKRATTHDDSMMTCSSSSSSGSISASSNAADSAGAGRTKDVASFCFECPRHTCDTCGVFAAQQKGDNKNNKISGFMHTCLKCPRSFHVQCLPPGCRWKSGCVLCPLHPFDVVEDVTVAVAADGGVSTSSAAVSITFDALKKVNLEGELENCSSSSAAKAGADVPSPSAVKTHGSSAVVASSTGSSRTGRVIKQPSRLDDEAAATLTFGSTKAAKAAAKARETKAKQLQLAQKQREDEQKAVFAFFDSLMIPENEPEGEDLLLAGHFRLEKHIKDAADNAPQDFKLIRSIDYESLPGGKAAARHPFSPEGVCNCKSECGPDCLNRILRIECYDTKNEDDKICGVGAGKCTNRAIQSREAAEVEPFREFKMGWGLRATAPVEAGALVIEYVGEAIDTATMRQRIYDQSINTPNDRDFYVMELGNNLYLDGKFKGSLSRFINHSCDPNCELQRWVVCGFMRIGIVAIKDIEAGEPLSYDYQFDTGEADSFKCYCGTDACRGSMAPKKKDKQPRTAGDIVSLNMSDHERKKLVIAAQKKANSITESSRIEVEWGRSYTGKNIPGDAINEIKNGPITTSVRNGQKWGLFLRRNVIRGTDMLSRRRAFSDLPMANLPTNGSGVFGTTARSAASRKSKGSSASSPRKKAKRSRGGGGRGDGATETIM